jgi:type II secretory pathway component GspD/PulD (secretin)
MKALRRAVLCAFLILTAGTLSAQSRGAGSRINFEFIDQNIFDILYAFSTYAKISIIADDTVTGRANFQFSGNNFDEAFDAFLLSNRLFVEKTTTLWVASHIRITTGENRVTLDSLDATPARLLEKLSQKTGVTIVQDILPSVKISLHAEHESPAELVTLIMKPFADYTVSARETYIEIKRNPVAQFPQGASAPRTGDIVIRENSGLFDANIEQARLGDVLERFFTAARREYTSFINAEQTVGRVKFSGKTFAEALTLILEQGSGEYTEIANFYHIFPLPQAEIVRRLRDDGKAWRRFTLRYIDTAGCLNLLQSRFPGLQTVTLENTVDFLVYTANSTALEIKGYISTIDIPRRAVPVRLKYIRSEDLFKALPPSVRREELVDAGNGNTLFFTGTPERLALLMEDLKLVDRPLTSIRYDLFIIQYEESSNLNFGASLEARPLEIGDMTMISGELGSLLNLNFDVITVFGYNFAAKLSAALTENQASVFADTTLFGLSGQEIQFQNTSTYRYRDSNIDPDTGKPIYSGVTREIVSGLTLKVNGWVSGDGMITTTVSATVSKRGADVSSLIGNPPPTSEKILTTQVRSRSGETVVLSGLRQNDATIVEQGVPLISKIPVLGWLFKSRLDTRENTQMVIYLVPHIDLSDEYTVEGRKTASLYERFVAPFMTALP